MTGAVRLSAEPASRGDIVSIANGARVEVTADAFTVVAESRHVVEEAIARGDAVYGVTTGLGHARNERLPPEALVRLQPMFVEMHVGAIGDPLPSDCVRAAMATRLVGFLRGGAGVSVGLVEGLANLLNYGIHPVVPRYGSVGAGDLSQMAVVGQALLGRGEVEVDGQRMPADRALADAELAPVVMQPKDGLAILAGNALSVGAGILLADRLARVLQFADRVVAVTMEAARGNPSILDPAVAGVRGSDGQMATSAVIRDALQGSRRAETGLSVQDPLSLRVVPQVHGACRDVVAACTAALEAELNAPSDNPLVDRESARLISNGNFHAMQVALALESVRVALAHVGLIGERRMGHLWDAVVGGMGSAGSDGPGGPDGPVDAGAGFPPVFAGLSLRYAAAARYTRLRSLAQPVTLDVPVLDLGVEDHAPNTLEAVWATSDAVDLLEELLVVELLIGMVGLADPALRADLGSGTTALVDAVDGALAAVPPGTAPAAIHRQVLLHLRDHP